MSEFLHPSIILFLAAAFVPFIKENVRKVFCLVVPAFVLWNVFQIEHGVHWTLDILGYSLVLAQADALSMVFVTIFGIAGFLGCLYMLEIGTTIEYAAAFFYLGSAYGVLFAGDFITLFVFWEMLTLGAATLVFARRTQEAQDAGMRYILYHIVGGLVFFLGIIMLTADGGSIALRALDLESLGTWLIFLGMGVNCAWPLAHTWLVDSYPEATAGGVIFMALITTKTAIYALVRCFPGQSELIWIGGVLAVFPVFFAVIENDLRRLLSYTLLNQLGFLLIGIGIGSDLALNGTVGHVFSHILYKSLLFMAVGAVLFRTGSARATALGGLWKSMPVTCICCIVGAASMAVPLFCGFVSKSMIMSAAAYKQLSFVWLLLLFAAVSAFFTAGIKTTYFAFFSRDAGHQVKDAPITMQIAMIMTACTCFTIGVFPQDTLYAILPFEATYEPYTTLHVMTQLQLLFFSALAFCLLLLAGIYPAEIRSVNLDADWMYRTAGKKLYAFIDRVGNDINKRSEELFIKRWTAKINEFASEGPTKAARHFGSPDIQEVIHMLSGSGASPLGFPVLVSVIALAAMVVFVF